MMQRRFLWTLVLTVLLLGLAVNLCAARARTFDITDYGAKADGQSDSSPAISKAIAAAVKAGGGQIVIPPAEKPYIITDSISLLSSNLHLVGTGATVYLRDGSAMGRTSFDDMLHIIKIRGTSENPVKNISVKGLTIDANFWGQTNNTGAWQDASKLAGITRGIRVDHAKKVLIEKVIIKRSFVGVTFGLGSHYCEVRDVKVLQFHHDAFGVSPGYVDRGASNIVFRDCFAGDSPNGRDGGLPGTRVKGWEIEEGAQDVKLIDCLVANTGANGFYIRPHGWHKEFATKNIQLIRCGVLEASDAAFNIVGRTYGQPVTNIRLTDCYTDTGTLAVSLNADNVVVKGGTFGQMVIGYFKDYDDPHHFFDGYYKDVYDHLPARTFVVDKATVLGDLRINANPGYDGQKKYLPDMTFTNLKIEGDLYIVGYESLAKMSGCKVAGKTLVVTPEEYFKPLLATRIELEPGQGSVKRAVSPATIDGLTDDACWKDSESLDIMNDWEKATRRKGGHSFAQLSYDDQALYVLMTCLEHRMDKLRTVVKDRDGDLWNDDCVEIFVHRQSDPPDYFRQFMISASGVIYDGDQTSGAKWNSSVKVATKNLKDRYIIEVAIPWSDLGGKPAPGEKIKANFARDRATNRTHWIWSWQYSIEGGFGSPAKMGTLTLD